MQEGVKVPMTRRLVVVIIIGMLVTSSVFAGTINDTCSIGFCGVNTAGLWVQLTGTSGGSSIPSGTWCTCSDTNAVTVNRMIAVFSLAKSMNSLVWVSGTLTNGILLIDTVCVP